MEILKNEVKGKIQFLIENKKDITYSLFEELFGDLNNKTQYKIIDELEQSNIFLIDEKENEEDNIKKIESEIELDIDFILEEVKRVTNAKSIDEDSLKEIFDFLSLDEYKNVIVILKKYGYDISKGNNVYIEKKEIFYDEEQIKQLKKFSNEELLKIYHSGNSNILESLILKNYKFIYYVIRKENLHLKSQMEEEDLFQEGLFGLKKAIDKYKEGEGNFTTYAYYWVKQQIKRAIEDKGFLIRVPAHIHEKLGKVMKLKENYYGEELIKKICVTCKCDRDKAWKYLIIIENAYSLISLNKKMKDDDDSYLIDFITGEYSQNSEKQLEIKELNAAIEEALDLVCGTKKHYKEIIIKRYGLNDYEPLTLDEIGKELNVTRERIRQIQSKIEKNLKKYLKNYKNYYF